MKTANLLAQIDSTTTPDFGIIKPNQSFIAPLANQTNNITSAEATYQFSPVSMVGTSATFSQLHYSNVDESLGGLSNGNTQAAQVFYTYRLSQKSYLGTTYRYQQATTESNAAPTASVSHSILLSYIINLQPHMTLSVFAGPEHSDISGQSLVPLGMWSPAAGVGYEWKGGRTSFTAGAVRRIADGGGLQGSVLLTSASAQVHSQLAKATDLSFGGGYSNNELLGSVGGDGHTVLGSVALEHHLVERLSLKVAYTREHQTYASTQTGNGHESHSAITL
jgi:hypothetical protein